MKFEIDVSNLTAGDLVEQSECERVIGFTRASDKYEYSFALMQLVEYVQKLLWKDGKQYTVVSDNGSMRVLTHEEASKYNAARFDGAIQKMRRCHRRLTAVDCGKFNEEARENHTKSILKSSRILTAIKTTRADVELVPHASIVPKRLVKS
jgi:hypothetical protein